MAVRSQQEEGFTLVELMAAITILAVGIIGVIGVMNSAFQVAGTTSSRNKGVAVATKHIETLRAVPYDRLVPVAPDATLTPQTEQVGGQAFTVTSVVTWADEVAPLPGSSTITPGAYKKAHVWVSWEDAAGPHDVHQTTLIYPGGQGVHNAAGTVAATVDGKPDPPLKVDAVALTTEASVDLVWVPPLISLTAPPPVAWVVQYSQDQFFTADVREVAATLPADLTTLRVSDLAPGKTYHFRVYSKAANGSLSNPTDSAAVTTVVTTVATCTVGVASVTPSAIKKKSASEGSGLSPAPQVEINTSGPCTDFSFSMEYSPRDGALDAVPLAQTSTGVYAAAVKGNQEWTVGEHDITVYSYELSTGAKAKRAAMRLIVCDHQKKYCP